jgi:hypothetical protein
MADQAITDPYTCRCHFQPCIHDEVRALAEEDILILEQILDNPVPRRQTELVEAMLSRKRKLIQALQGRA